MTSTMSNSDAASSEPRTDPEMSSTDPSMDEDGEYFDCSLCDINEGDDDHEEIMPLPGKESHITDMELFDFYLNKIKAMPRIAGEGDTPFNAPFWDCIRGVLEYGIPVGFNDLPDREQCMPKGPSDNGALITKFMNTAVINPVYPNVVADVSGVPIADVMTELLYAVNVGMLTMRWSPICERCSSVTCSKKSLKTFPALAYCKSCRYINTIDMLQKIKVVFIFNSDIFYYLAENLACKPSNKALSVTEFYAMNPATFSGSGFRWSVGCDGDLMLRPSLLPGKYRMRCPITATDGYFVVQREATEDDEPIELPIHVSDLHYKGGEMKTITVTHGKVRFHTYCDTKSFFILWIMQDLDPKTLLYLPFDERAQMTDAMTVMQHPTYKKLLEGTDREADWFAGAVQRMMMTELAKESEA